MTTVIDELVLQLKLDPSTWAPGERKALQSLRDLEAYAQRSGRKVEQAGSNVAQYFRFVEAPIASLRAKFEQLAQVTVKPQKNLNDIAVQARRTGTSVEAGALTATAGVRALGIAGLAALTMITALGKAMEFAARTSQRVFGTSVGAATAGIGVQQFTAISQALYRSGNVPQAQTQGWLAQYRIAQEQAKVGRPEQAIALNTTLAQLGAGVDVFSDRPEQAFYKIAQRFSRLNPSEATGQGALAGLSPELALALRSAGGNLPGMVRAEEYRATTEGQSDSARKLLQAQNDLANSWDALSRKLNEDIAPGLAKFDTWLARIIEKLTPIDVERAAVSTAAGMALPGAGIFSWPLAWLRKKIAGQTPTLSDASSPWATGPTGQANQAAPNDAYFNYGSIGGGPATARRYGSPAEGVTAVRDLLQRNYGGMTLRQMVHKYAPGSDNNDEALLTRRLAGWMGMSSDAVPNVNDPETMRRLVHSFIANEHGGVYPMGLRPGDIDRALGQQGNAAGTDPSLDRAMQFSMGRLPAGYTARMTSGLSAGHAPGSEHHTGMAEDWQIYDPSGNPIPNRGGASPLYQQAAVRAMAWLMVHDPEKAKRFAWGGHFETSAGSGVSDDMHFGVGYGPRGQIGDIYAEHRQALAMIQSGELKGLEGGSVDNSRETNVSIANINVHTNTSNPLKHGGAIASVLNRTVTQANSGLN